MQFVVTAWDFTDPEALGRRMAMREAHLERAKEAYAEGTIISAAAMLNEDGNMMGSSLIVSFDSKEALDKWLEDEPYVTGKVWDKIKAYPVKLAPLAG